MRGASSNLPSFAAQQIFGLREVYRTERWIRTRISVVQVEEERVVLQPSLTLIALQFVKRLVDNCRLLAHFHLLNRVVRFVLNRLRLLFFGSLFFLFSEFLQQMVANRHDRQSHGQSIENILRIGDCGVQFALGRHVLSKQFYFQVPHR